MVKPLLAIGPFGFGFGPDPDTGQLVAPALFALGKITSGEIRLGALVGAISI